MLGASGFFPVSPALAEIVFDVDLLDHYNCAVTIGGMSKEGYSEGLRSQLQRKYPEAIPKFGANFRDATFWFSVSWELAFGSKQSSMTLDQLGPSCFGGTRQSVVVRLDGNSQHSRLANAVLMLLNQAWLSVVYSCQTCPKPAH